MTSPLLLSDEDLKEEVRKFWNSGSCGEIYAHGDDLRQRLDAQFRTRYELEPWIPKLAKFEEGAGKDVLEIGVGMGADHLNWAMSKPKSLSGIDLTSRGIEFTKARLELHGYKSNLQVGDAENLPFPDNSFDIVYSWGVVHCSPDTPKTIREIHRVLRPGGTARVLIYSKYCMVGYMLWVRYGLMRGRPFRSLDDVYAEHLESPGIKCYTPEETRPMFKDFVDVDIHTFLCFGDLLEGGAGVRRHSGPILSLAQKLYPRWFVRRFMKNHGMNLMIEAKKKA